MLEMKVTGLAELDQALTQLPEKLQRNVLRAALRAGAKAIAEEAERNVPVDSGDLRDSIRVTSRIRAGMPTASVKAGGRAKVAGKQLDVFYAHMIEYGTAKHFIDGPLYYAGEWHPYAFHPGIVKKPFMRPAMDSQAGEAVSRTADYVRRRLSTKFGIDVPDPEPETD